GIFRVNYHTGEVSVCYVLEERVVCTPQTTPPPGGTAPGSAVAAPSGSRTTPGAATTRPQ
ncbi:hypothetical protein NL504_28305, partial [Klebsiella pneumoniae]|nr:hypothetical protein [Klebsiella pneumoniae]